MEGAKGEGERLLVVERSFDRCRLEDQLMESAYEEILPTVRLPLQEHRGVGLRHAEQAFAVKAQCARGA